MREFAHWFLCEANKWRRGRFVSVGSVVNAHDEERARRGYPGEYAYALRPNFPRDLSVASSILSAAAATFSSRCSTCDVPGMGSIAGERQRSHARASCDGVIFNFAAARS